ncbi:MAG: hypothetical protein A4E49_01794 [Methanosaeta sp. PtaU1.Bin112]|nr:MAG: hypothetical protein A4E49_01794 [Methanosaeta sp. PtaU1.Bin112]
MIEDLIEKAKSIDLDQLDAEIEEEADRLAREKTKFLIEASLKSGLSQMPSKSFFRLNRFCHLFRANAILCSAVRLASTTVRAMTATIHCVLNSPRNIPA